MRCLLTLILIGASAAVARADENESALLEQFKQQNEARYQQWKARIASLREQAEGLAKSDPVKGSAIIASTIVDLDQSSTWMGREVRQELYQALRELASQYDLAQVERLRDRASADLPSFLEYVGLARNNYRINGKLRHGESRWEPAALVDKFARGHAIKLERVSASSIAFFANGKSFSFESLQGPPVIFVSDGAYVFDARKNLPYFVPRGSDLQAWGAEPVKFNDFLAPDLGKGTALLATLPKSHESLADIFGVKVDKTEWVKTRDEFLSRAADSFIPKLTEFNFLDQGVKNAMARVFVQALNHRLTFRDYKGENLEDIVGELLFREARPIPQIAEFCRTYIATEVNQHIKGSQ